MDGAGNGLAVWVQYDGTTTSIYANRLEQSSVGGGNSQGR